MSVDRPGPVPAAHHVDPGPLAAWLSAATLVEPGTPITLQWFGRGYSNHTFAVTAGDRSWVVRRAPPGVTIATAHDMAREARVLEALSAAWGKAPKVLGVCDDPSVLGAPFFLMERRYGTILRAEHALPAAVAAPLAVAAAGTLAEIHRLNPALLGGPGRPGYVRRQVHGWTERWRASRTEPIAAMDGVARWLTDHQPDDHPHAVVHNDFKYDNLLLSGGGDAPYEVTTVLDWEMATVGDPRLDLGMALAYWVQDGDPPALRALRFGPTDGPGAPDRDAFAHAYVAAGGVDPGDLTFPYVFGLFKLGVIAQQLYARHAAGLSDEPRYARMGAAVRAVAAHAARAAQLPPGR